METAEEMCRAVEMAVAETDLLIMAAAVADYRPAQRSSQKIKKGKPDFGLTLQRTTDILSMLAGRNEFVRVGFAAETENLLGAALDKLRRKDLDMIVANDAETTIGGSDAEVTVVDRTGMARALPRGPKAAVARAILDVILEQFGERMGRKRLHAEDEHVG